MAETATSTAHINTASALPTLPQLVGDAEAAYVLSQGIVVIDEDPITCPRCGRRTDWRTISSSTPASPVCTGSWPRRAQSA